MHTINGWLELCVALEECKYVGLVVFITIYQIMLVNKINKIVANMELNLSFSDRITTTYYTCITICCITLFALVATINVGTTYWYY